MLTTEEIISFLEKRVGYLQEIIAKFDTDDFDGLNDFLKSNICQTEIEILLNVIRTGKVNYKY